MTPVSGLTVFGAWVYKLKANGIAFFFLNIGGMGWDYARKTVCTIDAGYRPNNIYVVPLAHSGEPQNDAYAQINTDGTVEVKGGGNRVFLNCWYMT